MTEWVKTVMNLETGVSEVIPMTPEEIAQAQADQAAWEAAQAAYVPPEVPMWSVRTVLQNEGLFDQADAAIKASSDNALKNVWEYGNYAQRSSSAIASLGETLGLTSAQIDQMFRDAAKISV